MSAADTGLLVIDVQEKLVTKIPAADALVRNIAFLVDVARLLDHLHITRAHVVGYSMGGSIALKLLETHPERLLSVTSGGSTGFRATDKREPWDSAFVSKLVAGEPLSQAMIETAPPGMPAPSPEQRDR